MDSAEKLEVERSAWLHLQMPSFIRGDETESTEELFELPAHVAAVVADAPAELDRHRSGKHSRKSKN